MQNDDAGEDVGVGEDRGVPEVHDLLQRPLRGEIAPQGLAVAGPQPLVGHDVGHAPAPPELPQPLLVEVHVQVRDAVVGLRVGGGQVRLEVAQRLLANVGRVADDGVEASVVSEGTALTVEEDVWELQLPVEEAALTG